MRPLVLLRRDEANGGPKIQAVDTVFVTTGLSTELNPWNIRLWEPKTFPCCSLNCASLTVAIIWLIVGSLTATFWIYGILSNIIIPSGEGAEDGVRRGFTILFLAISVIMFLITVGWIAVASLYVHGVRKNKYKLLRPMVVWQAIHMTIVSILFFISIPCSGIIGGFTLLVQCTSVYILVFAWDYCIYCILRTNYLKLKKCSADNNGHLDTFEVRARDVSMLDLPSMETTIVNIEKSNLKAGECSSKAMPALVEKKEKEKEEESGV